MANTINMSIYTPVTTPDVRPVVELGGAAGAALVAAEQLPVAGWREREAGRMGKQRRGGTAGRRQGPLVLQSIPNAHACTALQNMPCSCPVQPPASQALSLTAHLLAHVAADGAHVHEVAVAAAAAAVLLILPALAKQGGVRRGEAGGGSRRRRRARSACRQASRLCAGQVGEHAGQAGRQALQRTQPCLQVGTQQAAMQHRHQQQQLCISALPAGGLPEVGHRGELDDDGLAGVIAPLHPRHSLGRLVFVPAGCVERGRGRGVGSDVREGACLRAGGAAERARRGTRSSGHGARGAAAAAVADVPQASSSTEAAPARGGGSSTTIHAAESTQSCSLT